VQGAVVGAALGACVVGLLGADGGILWVVGGIWVVRRAFGHPPGVAWSLALLTAGFRWGTLSLGDLQAATRALGPTIGTGSTLAVVAAVFALAGALLEESASDALRRTQPIERAVGAIALLALVPAYCAPGIGEPTLFLSVAWWAGAGAVLAVIALLGSRGAVRLPVWVAPLLVVTGTVLVGATSVYAGAVG
jgi:hypothetical protein